MTGTTLMWHLTQIKPAVIPRFAKAVPHLVKLLKKLVSSSNVPNYTIGGVCDPFLQVRSTGVCMYVCGGRVALCPSEEASWLLRHLSPVSL
jgi:hypothetical protein